MKVRLNGIFQRISLCIFIFALASIGLAFKFEDENSLFQASNLGEKIPIALGACGTLIHQEYVLTHVDVGDVEEVKINEIRYPVLERIFGPNLGISSLNKLQLLHLAMPVVDVLSIQVFLEPEDDFVLKDVEASVNQGTMSFHVGPAPSPEFPEGMCRNLKVLDFDQPKVVGALPVTTITNMRTKKNTNKLAVKEGGLKEIVMSPFLTDSPMNMRYYEQRSLYSTDFEIDIPLLINSEPFLDTGGAIFTVLGKKNGVPFDADDIVVFGVRGSDASGMESLLEATGWIETAVLYNKADSLAMISPSSKVRKQFAEEVMKSAFLLGTDFSHAEKLVKSCNSKSDFSKQFREHYGISHFALRRQTTSRALSDVGESKFDDCAPNITNHYRNDGHIAAVLRLDTFRSTSTNGPEKCYDKKLIKELLKEAEIAGVQILIVDLRSNLGGSTENSRHFVRVLSGADVEGFNIYKSTYKKARKAAPTEFPKNVSELSPEQYSLLAQYLSNEHEAKSKKPLFTGKITVLIGNDTSSAGESVALALNEQVSADLVGTTTCGHVLVSDTTPICYGYAVQKPIADFISYKGTRIEGVGVEPTFTLSKDIDALTFVLEQFYALDEVKPKPRHAEPRRPKPKRIKRAFGRLTSAFSHHF